MVNEPDWYNNPWDHFNEDGSPVNRDILKTLRFKERSASYEMAPICREAADEIERLRASLISIGIINASTNAHYSPDIDRIIREAALTAAKE